MINPPACIPGPAEWSGYENDLDARYAYNLLYGKSLSEAQAYFGQNRSIERAGELQFLPRGAFQYYVLAFAQFTMSEQARGDADSASPFLRLLLARENADPGSVSEIYPLLAPAVEFISLNQQYFDADEDIYGSFRELADQIRSECLQYVRTKT